MDSDGISYASLLIDDSEPEFPEDAASMPKDPRDEIRAYLSQLDGILGDAYRGKAAGQTPDEIANERGTTGNGWVYGAWHPIDLLLENDLRANSLTTLEGTARTLRGVLKKGAAWGLSPAALEHVESCLTIVNRRLDALDPVENAKATAEEGADEAQAEASLDMTRPGIYAFSYGWYLEHPDEHDRYLVKVGRADCVKNRLASYRQGVKTHLPEPLALLRVYFVDDITQLERLEKSFHSLLTHAGHENPRYRSKETGTEWFMTTAEYLDAVAKAVGIDKGMYIGGSDFA